MKNYCNDFTVMTHGRNTNKMQFIIFIILPLVLGAADFSLKNNNSLPSLYPEVIPADYETSYIKIINSSVEYVFLYSETQINESARINVESNATIEDPLLVVVKQRVGILSWQIPLLVERNNSIPQLFHKTSRTLCSSRDYRSNLEPLKGDRDTIVVSIFTGSDSSVSFNLTVDLEDDFYLSLGKSREISITPAEPRYYAYNFSDKIESASVLMKVESHEDTCMTVSIQNTVCPVFDLERNIQFSGYWQTVSQLGGISISKEIYPKGFFVVLVVKGDDIDCTGSLGSEQRNKTVTLTISPNITTKEGIRAASIALMIGIAFFSAYAVGVITHNVRLRRKLRQELEDLNSPEPLRPEELLTPVIEEDGPRQSSIIEVDSSIDEDDIDMLDDALSDKEIIRTKRVLAVSDLARKDPKILRHKSRLYLYYLGTIAVFYALPVVQLVATYQNVLHVTGNQDLCYYNFLCSHPFLWLSDFNHVFSNFAYVLLGLLFMLLTYVREQGDLANEEKKKSYGIPQHYGLFYAMGTALIMEGVLSACYHMCPSHSNFQFDTSFMYIISVLCMVKIYQTRHPDINARATVTFAVLALMIFLGTVGVLNGTDCFWILFSIVHLSVCLLITVQIYYMGRFRLNKGVLQRTLMTLKHDARAGVGYLVKPIYPARLMLLAIANIANVALAIVGNIHHQRQETKDFATFLLAVLMMNLLLYTCFYIVMKLCSRERILLQPLCYIILSIITWGFALYFFIHKSISWALLPAQSRQYNMPCKLLNFFDFHDIWHFLSALAMFFSFMVLLTLDDDLEDTHRSQIPVF
ncbi:SID1 transmembrane family member 2-like [Chelonus insularis]|uniref:SID1 transmembrane family member 2-like n=1 Tax=Chelonus insularis TaxID=460826 RepID=UPI0015897D5D|nr:SID1 transmembrane family member 2-like [Chelonus insularis]